jgi:hypothetical protein
MYALAKNSFPGDDPVWRYPEDIFLQSLTILVKEKERGQENTTRDLKENWKDERDHPFDSWYNNSCGVFYGRQNGKGILRSRSRLFSERRCRRDPTRSKYPYTTQAAR